MFADTGALKWRYRETGSHFASPTVSGGTVLVSSAIGSANFRPLKRDLGANGITPSAAVGSRVHAVADGVLYALRAGTGTR